MACITELRLDEVVEMFAEKITTDPCVNRMKLVTYDKNRLHPSHFELVFTRKHRLVAKRAQLPCCLVYLK